MPEQVEHTPMSDKVKERIENGETFIVRIIKCSSPQSWYRKRIGHEFEVYHELGTDKTTFTLEHDRTARITRRFINSFDCELKHKQS